VLASNLANADTPNFKAKDLDFKQALAQARGEEGGPARMQMTHAGHMSGSPAAGEPDLMFRSPLQPSLDGNTVDSQLEKAKFAENTLQYQTTLTFLNRKFSGLMGAIKGE
jgi:flagellar basal-body rod protein FlgB